MAAEPPRSRAARHAAEQSLVRVVHHYGSTPEFVLIGGLVPELLCSTSGMVHAGTTDVDVQVDPQRVWRWQTEADGRRAVVKFELLADLVGQRGGAIVTFDECEALGAVNLRGTGFASRDAAPMPIRSRVGGAGDASRRTGMTSPSCCSTTTSEAPILPSPSPWTGSVRI